MESSYRAVKSILAKYSNSIVPPPELVAVSKTKPASDILKLYKLGQRDFGENYIQELVEKSKSLWDDECRDIRWHFIGQLQSNKVKMLVGSVPGLFAVHGVDSRKKADLLNREWLIVHQQQPPSLLQVYIQVNTSGEDSKSGLDAQSQLNEIVELARYICDGSSSSSDGGLKGLKLAGLMTIGSVNSSHQLPNPDFVKLREIRDLIMAQTQCGPIGLSMGMSDDFEHALEMGSSCVRIGSKLFGARSQPMP